MVASRSALILLLSFTVGLLSLTGCRICDDREDEAYPTYGGIWQRTDRFHGRVGSIFAPAGAKIGRGSSVFSDEEAASGGGEDEFEVLPPGSRDSGEDRATDEENDSEEELNELGEADMEAVQLQQPFGDPESYTDF